MKAEDNNYRKGLACAQVPSILLTNPKSFWFVFLKTVHQMGTEFGCLYLHFCLFGFRHSKEQKVYSQRMQKRRIDQRCSMTQFVVEGHIITYDSHVHTCYHVVRTGKPVIDCSEQDSRQRQYLQLTPQARTVRAVTPRGH